MTCSGELTCPLFAAAADDDDERDFALSDYEGATARWCPGCGDHSILTAVERLRPGAILEAIHAQLARVRRPADDASRGDA